MTRRGEAKKRGGSQAAPARTKRGPTVPRSPRAPSARGGRAPDRSKAEAPRPARKKRRSDDAEAPVLRGVDRRHLRALAHGLEPIVHVGHQGLTESVVSATRRALLDHELVKVRLHEPEDKQGMASELATRARAALCGLVGHTVILYKPHPDDPRIRR